MHANIKPTRHAYFRIEERTSTTSKAVVESIGKGEYYGLPRQSHNKRVALVHINGESLVVIHTHTTKEIITVMRLAMYIERNPELLEIPIVQAYLQKDNEHATLATVPA